MSEAAWSLHARTKRMGMAPKTAASEHALVKFEEEFLRQKESAKAQKAADEERYRQAVQGFRQERIKNLQTNHAYMKEWERNLSSLWKHSTVTMQELKDAKIRFNSGMTGKIKQAEDTRSALARQEFEQGIKNFEDNANRLGVELEHDPDRTDKVEKAPFNFHSMMQKVQAKSALNEASRKQKESRERYIALKQAKMREEVAKQANIKNKLEKYIKYTELHKGDASQLFVNLDKENFIAAQRERQYLEKKAKNTTHMEEIVKNLKTMSDEEYKKKNQEIKFIKQVHMFKERDKEYNQHYKICYDAMDSILRLMEVCYDKLPKEKDGSISQYGQIDNEVFKDLLKRLMNQEPLEDVAPEKAELQSTILTYSKLKDNISTVNIQSSKDNYLEGSSSYKAPLTYGDLMYSKAKLDHKNPTLVRLLQEYIELVHPMQPVQPFPPENPNLLPVRLSIVGDRLSGKKTLAKKLSTLLGLPVIDVDKLIARAKALVKHEENEEDDKKAGVKKGQPAKPDRKKDTQVQLTEFELELQKFGVKLKNMELLGHPVTDEIKLELIQLEIKHLALEKKLPDIKAAFHEAKVQMETKKQQRLANPKDDKKLDKNKSAPKLVPKDGNTNHDEQEPLFEEKYPFIQGYILLNFPSTEAQANLLSQRLMNYQSLEERLNPNAETMKENLGRLYPVPPNPPETNSFPVVDHLIILNMDHESIVDRASKMKVDPTTGTVYDPVVNPALETDKKLVARLEPFSIAGDISNEESESTILHLESFLARFGFEELSSSVVHRLNGTDSPAVLEKHIVAMISNLLNFKYTLYEAEQLPAKYKLLIPDEYSTENMPDVSEKNESIKPDIKSSQLGVPGDHTHGRRPSMKEFGSGTGSQVRIPKNTSYYSGSKGSIRKMETMSQRSGLSRKDKLLAHSLDSWEKLVDDYTEALEKNLRESKDMFQVVRMHFENSQKVFSSIFREKRDFHFPLTSFADGYRRFSADNPEVVKSDYCKKKLYEKIDSIHDQMWGELEKCREKATKEKDKMVTKHLINADIQSLCKIALSMIAGEMNKLYNLK